MPSEPNRPRFRPAPLLFEPTAPEEPEERFFDLDDIADPEDMLRRATQLAEAFRAAADTAVDYQAIAAARLADPRRFDRLTVPQIAELTGWGEEYTGRMVEHGSRLRSARGE